MSTTVCIFWINPYLPATSILGTDWSKRIFSFSANATISGIWRENSWNFSILSLNADIRSVISSRRLERNSVAISVSWSLWDSTTQLEQVNSLHGMQKYFLMFCSCPSIRHISGLFSNESKDPNDESGVIASSIGSKPCRGCRLECIRLHLLHRCLSQESHKYLAFLREPHSWQSFADDSFERMKSMSSRVFLSFSNTLISFPGTLCSALQKGHNSFLLLHCLLIQSPQNVCRHGRRRGICTPSSYSLKQIVHSQNCDFSSELEILAHAILAV